MIVKKTLQSAIRTLTIATALPVIFSGSAFALDGQAVAQRIQAYLVKQGSDITYKSVDTDGSTVVIRNLTTTLSASDAEKVNLGDLTLQDVSEEANGVYLIGNASLPDIEYFNEAEKAKLQVTGISMSNIRLPEANAPSSDLSQMFYYEAASVGSIHASSDGKEFFALKEIDYESSPIISEAPINMSVSVKSVDIDLKTISELEQAKATADSAGADIMHELGYDKIHGSYVSTGSWSPHTGDLTMDKNELNIANVGKLNLTFQLGGYDMKFVEGIEQAAKETAGDGDNEALPFALLGLIQQLSVSNISIRFDDDSLTSKLLDYYAKQQGSDAPALINQIKGMTPLMLGMLGVPEFAAEASSAIGTYLDNPKSIEISAQPATAQSMAVLIATATTDPTKLLSLLAVKLKANQ